MDRLRVLVVDDNDGMRRMIILLLRDADDMEVVGEAADGNAAVEMARWLVPDIVIMDVNMPGMDGIKATQAIHSEFPQMNVIGFSLFDSPEVGEAMLEAGAISC